MTLFLSFNLQENKDNFQDKDNFQEFETKPLLLMIFCTFNLIIQTIFRNIHYKKHMQI